MKKIFSYLVILLLFLPIFVLADGASPSFAPYNAYVSDKDGASLYDYDYDKETYIRTKHFLEYNHQIKVEDEEEVSKDLIYGYIEYNDKYYYINLNKISPLKEEYTVEDLKKEYEIDPRETNEYYRDEMVAVKNVIIMSDNVSLRKGPSIKYEEKKEKLQKELVITKKAEVGSWMYVENDNLSGWINTDDIIVMQAIDGSIWLLEDTQTYDNVLISKSKVLDIKLPKNEKFNNIYYYYYDEETDEETEEYYVYRVEYEGQAYYIDSNVAKYAQNDSGKLITYKETNCYDEVNSNIIKTIPQNTKVEKKYYSVNTKTDWVYISIGDENYWIKTSDTGLYFESPIKLVEDIEDVKNSITIPANTEFENYYYVSNEELYYVEYEGKNYWFYGKDLTADYIDEEYGEYTTFDETYLYDKPNGDRTGVSIPKDTDVTIKYAYFSNEENETNHWYYLDSKKYKGWISDQENDMTKFKEELAKSQVNETESDKRESYVKPQKVISEPEIVKSDNKLSKKELIIICSLSAVIIALLIIVIILLINKKKSTKQNNVLEETNSEKTESTEKPSEVIEKTTIAVETNKEENKDA